MPPPIKKKGTEKVARQIVHPEEDAKICIGPDAVTVQQAMDLLGWETETDEVKFGSDYLFVDFNGKKVRCLNNTKNRPFNESHAKTLAQDILNGHWRFNGESIIIGETGLVLSAQHRLIGLVLAGQTWAGPQAEHWQKVWKTEPTLDTVVVLGVKETDDVTRTLDNVRPRTLGDVLYTSKHLEKVKQGDRKPVARMVDYAVRMLWDRTGARTDAFAPRRTHAESLDFIDRHPSVLKCVKHIYEEDQEGSIGRLVSPGTAAAAMYLMAASASDYDAYRDTSDGAEPCSEKTLDLSNWDQAELFWTMVSSKDGDLLALRRAIGMLASVDTGIGGTPDEKVALLVKAWAAIAEHGRVEDSDLVLKYRMEDDVRYLADFPTFGGIDIGKPGKEDDEIEEEVAEDEASAPTPEEIEAETARIRAEKEEAEKESARKEEARKDKRKEEARKVQAVKNGTVKTADGAVPVEKPKKLSRKEIEAAQTARAQADEAKLLAERETEKTQPANDRVDGKPAPSKAKTPAAQVSNKRGGKK